MILVEDLSKQYKIAKRSGGALKFLFAREYETINAVRSISFSIDAGEMVAFVGPNGAGKSTTIKLLSGILAPTSGIALVMGNDPFAKRKANAYHIGVVFGQRSQLWWDLPIGDTFVLLKRIYKVSSSQYDRNLGMIKEYLDLDSIWHQPVRQLSLGQRMRAEIAASILHNPSLLILDEPTIGLDIVAKRQIREFITALNENFGTTVLLTSHDMKDVEEICDRILVIDHGDLIIDCSVDELKQKYNKTTVLHANFKTPVATLSIDGTRCIPGKDGMMWTAEIDKEKLTVGQVLYEISKDAEIADIEIRERAIEDIIHDIYTHGTEP